MIMETSLENNVQRTKRRFDFSEWGSSHTARVSKNLGGWLTHCHELDLMQNLTVFDLKEVIKL